VTTWLTVLLTLVAIAAWVATAVLVRAAFQRPRIGALTERAVVAFFQSAFGTVCVILVLNTDTNGSILAIEAARILFRVLLLGLLLTPVWWLYLYLSNRLGGAE
jgi:hypothetical protein